MDSSHDLTQKELFMADISRLPWTKGIGEQAIGEIIDASEFLEVAEGEIVSRAGDTLTAVYFVTRGRLWASVLDLFGKIVLERPMPRGACLGLFAVAQPEDYRVDVKAMEPTSLLKLSFDELLRLTAKHRQFQLNVYRLASELVREIVNVDRKREHPSTVGVVHQSAVSRALTVKLVKRL